MKDWVHEKIRGLLARVSEQMEKTIADPSEECVHDLRTSIRRTRESLAVFEDFFPGKGVKAVRKRLQKVMHTTAAIRNRDISLELLSNSRIPSVRLKRTLEREREHYREQLLEELHEIAAGKTDGDWRGALGL